MNNLKFKEYGIFPGNKKWEQSIKREVVVNKEEIRTDFEKDFNKIIYTEPYRRLKHKTQVFFSPENDHISTRAEHVMLVESTAYTIAKYLGLNIELTRAIALGHDIGHSPFGHSGEKILNEISKKYLNKTFWHERNGIEILDDIALLVDENGDKKNLNLTYATRDGIISHCGEVDQNELKPREKAIDLNNYKKINQYQPFTYEGCVVKISDKIAYVGRDIEDAVTLGLIDESNIKKLYKILKINPLKQDINNSSLINRLIRDICENSNPDVGICLSSEAFELLNVIKKFNYENIYLNEKVVSSHKYFELIINEIFNLLSKLYNGTKTMKILEANADYYPLLITNFISFISKYFVGLRCDKSLKNKPLFTMKNQKDYIQAIIYYISGMTDNFAMKVYDEIVGFNFK